MLRFLADENVKSQLVRGLLRGDSSLDIVRVQDVGLRGADDATVLRWAAQEARLLITHDVNTVLDEAYKRLGAEEHVPGVIIVP